MNALLKIAGVLTVATAMTAPVFAQTTIVAPSGSTAGTYMDYMKTVYDRGTGSELRKPMGIAIVGGLLLSQVITLYTTPVIYLYLDRLSKWMRRKRVEAGIPGLDVEDSLPEKTAEPVAP